MNMMEYNHKRYRIYMESKEWRGSLPVCTGKRTKSKKKERKSKNCVNVRRNFQKALEKYFGMGIIIGRYAERSYNHDR